MRLKRIHLEAVGGVAGDMLLAALCDLGANTARIERAFASLQTPGLALSTRRVRVNGEGALYVRSAPVSGDHGHRHLEEVLAVIDRVAASPAAKRLARRIFRRLAAAEGRVHGDDAQHVLLHEVGELDSVLDILGIAIALDSLGRPRVTCTPLPVGAGTVMTRHGRLRCPVPVVRELARRCRVPLVRVPILGETVTPTGIAVVAEVCHRFVAQARGKATVVGVGAGTRRFADRPNVIRVYGFAAKR
jgi:pyridinium-3,5-bisthiocarboxylic acid mononucleotide nickel chelatase